MTIWMDRDTSTAPQGQSVELKVFVEMTGDLVDLEGKNGQPYKLEFAFDRAFFKPPK